MAKRVEQVNAQFENLLSTVRRIVEKYSSFAHPAETECLKEISNRLSAMEGPVREAAILSASVGFTKILVQHHEPSLDSFADFCRTRLHVDVLALDSILRAKVAEAHKQFRAASCSESAPPGGAGSASSSSAGAAGVGVGVAAEVPKKKVLFKKAAAAAQTAAAPSASLEA